MISSKINSLGAKNRILITSAAFILMIAAILHFVIFKTVADIRQYKEDIAEENSKLEQKLYEERNKSIILAKLNKIEPQMELADNLYIRKDRAIEFFTGMEALANKHGVEQEIKLSDLPEKSKTSYLKTPLRISCKGRYEELMGYLADLERMKYLISVESLQMHSDNSSQKNTEDGSGAASPVIIEIEASTYWK